MARKKQSYEAFLATRNKIFAAAAAVFEEDGINSAKISKIACRASVADGTVYLYFFNKDELAREWLANAPLSEEAKAAVYKHAPLDGIFGGKTPKRKKEPHHA